MKRRTFITLLGVAAAWPLAARAQQPANHPRRIGILMSAADDPEGQARVTAFREGLQKLRWTEGRNVWIDYRWTGGDAAPIRAYANEMENQAPAHHPLHPLPFLPIFHHSNTSPHPLI